MTFLSPFSERAVGETSPCSKNLRTQCKQLSLAAWNRTQIAEERLAGFRGQCVLAQVGVDTTGSASPGGGAREEVQSRSRFECLAGMAQARNFAAGLGLYMRTNLEISENGATPRWRT